MTSHSRPRRSPSSKPGRKQARRGGDLKDMPPPPRFSTDWKLGPPDLVLEPAEEFLMPASGPDTYRCFVLPTNLVSDAYVSAIDFRPANVRVVHHINAFLDTTGAAGQRRGRTRSRIHILLGTGSGHV